MSWWQSCGGVSLASGLMSASGSPGVRQTNRVIQGVASSLRVGKPALENVIDGKHDRRACSNDSDAPATAHPPQINFVLRKGFHARHPVQRGETFIV